MNAETLCFLFAGYFLGGITERAVLRWWRRRRTIRAFRERMFTVNEVRAAFDLDEPS